MAIKEKKLYSIDKSVVNDFEKICKEKDILFSEGVESLMKDFISKRGEVMMDDLFAPRMQGIIKRTIQDEIERVMKVLYHVRIDSAAVVHMLPAIHKKDILAFENTISEFIQPELLTKNPESKGAQFNEGKKMIDNARQFAHKEIQTLKKTGIGAQT